MTQRSRAPIVAGLLLAVLAMVASGCARIDGTAVTADAGADPVPTIVILDASDSMNIDDAPGPRIDAAKTAVTALTASLPGTTPFGLVVFGAQRDSRTTPQPQGCADIETAVPLAPRDTENVRGVLDGVTARGYTPIGGALEAAADQAPERGPASIVLISDGASTCAPDPCETAAAIHTARPDVTISAVGFLTDAPELACVADKGGGLFVTADNAQQLTARLAAAQNSRQGATRLAPTARGGIEIGQRLGDIRSAHPDFPATGTSEGTRVLIVWLDCTYVFDGDVLVEIAPGDPPGSAGVTIDGVTRGTAGARAVQLYGPPVTDAHGEAVFVADRSAGTAYRIGYRGGRSIAEGTVETVVLCRCLPATSPSSSAAASSAAGTGPRSAPAPGPDRDAFVGQWVGHGRSVTLNKDGTGEITMNNGAGNASTHALTWKGTAGGIEVTVGEQTGQVGNGTMYLKQGQTLDGELRKDGGITYLQLGNTYCSERYGYGPVCGA